MSRSAALASNLGLPTLTLRVVPANGDCFYTCLSLALGEPHTVQSLRQAVSDAIDEDQLDMFRMAYDAQVPGYEFMRRTRTLEALKSLILIKGSDTQSKLCVWAESFAIQTLATHLRATLLIYDEESRGDSRFVRISPALPSSSSSSPIPTPTSPVHILFQRTRRSHYNLITDNGGLAIDDAGLLAKFGVDVGGDGGGDNEKSAATKKLMDDEDDEKKRKKSGGDDVDDDGVQSRGKTGSGKKRKVEGS
jgi:hypothetical protein